MRVRRKTITLLMKCSFCGGTGFYIEKDKSATCDRCGMRGAEFVRDIRSRKRRARDLLGSVGDRMLSGFSRVVDALLDPW